VNDADWNVPATPVMLAPAAAFVVDTQFFARWSTPLLYVDVTQPVLPGSNTPGSSAAAAVAAIISHAVCL
jgi:homoserine kinase